MKTKFSHHKFAILFVLLLSLSTTNSFAQEKIKVLEIITSGFNSSFGVRYKFGNENHLFRLSLLSVDTSTESLKVLGNRSHFGGSAGVGVEFPVKLNEKLHLYYGPELRGGLSSTESHVNRYNFSVNGILGFAYHLNETLRLGAEVAPSLSYLNMENTDPHEIWQFRMSNSAMLVFGFSF